MKRLTTLLFFVFGLTTVPGQKLEIVEGDLTTLDTATIVSVEFYYAGMTINELPNAENFMRAFADNKKVISGFISARDSLNQLAFMEGYTSAATETIPELISDTKTTRFHLIVKSVHWTSSLDLSKPDEVVLEYILLDNPQRRLQQGRYYMRKVTGEQSTGIAENMSSAYYLAGKSLATTLLHYDPEAVSEE